MFNGKLEEKARYLSGLSGYYRSRMINKEEYERELMKAGNELTLTYFSDMMANQYLDSFKIRTN